MAAFRSASSHCEWVQRMAASGRFLPSDRLDMAAGELVDLAYSGDWPRVSVRALHVG
jgi:hypothetical protein